MNKMYENLMNGTLWNEINAHTNQEGQNMIKIATITPINCINNQQDGDIFAICWDPDTGALIGRFENGTEEMLEYTAHTLEQAVDIAYSLYAPSAAYIYEPEEIDV